MAEIAGTEFARELFAQRAWLARLARSLAEDHASAEDLVQETWVAAMRTQPAKDAGLRAWLATVMRNRARSKAREERNRKRREQWASRHEALPSTGEVVERAAIQQEVADCVLRLPDPYREIVLLRFFDDVPPREIARQLGVPVGTVKTRLARGLERLRELLDQTHGGDRSVWMGSIALLFVVPQKSWVWKGFSAAGVLGLLGGASWAALELSDSQAPLVREVATQRDLPGRDRRAVSVAPPTEPIVSIVDRGREGKENPTAGNRAGGVELSTPSRDELPLEEHLSRADRERAIRSTKRTFPGDLVSLEALRVEIGLDLDEVEVIRRSQFDGSERLRELGLEEFDLVDSTPKHKREVPAFALMNTEVTNEQFLRYIELSFSSSGLGWGLGSRRTYLRRDLYWWSGAKKDEASADWIIRASEMKLPVTMLSFESAQGYADWMGLRLPNEFEWERAVRGKRDREYAWDRESGERDTAGSSDDRGKIRQVGFSGKKPPKDAVYDLSDNVSEWTVSNSAPYETKRKKNAPVYPLESVGVRGGSFALPATFDHAGLRQPRDSDTWEDVGFRCAASLEPGVDRVAALTRMRGKNLSYLATAGKLDVTRVIAMDRWIEEEMDPKRRGGEVTGVANRVLAGYEVILFAPVKEVRETVSDPYSQLKLGVFHCAVSGEPSTVLENASYELRVQFNGRGNPTLELRHSQALAIYPADGEARLETKKAKQRMTLSPKGQSTVRYVSFQASVPTEDGKWWNVSWSVPMEPRVLEGYWRTKPWHEKRIK